MYILTLAKVTGLLVAFASIPFGLIIISELIIGAAWGWRGQIPEEIRHRDDPKGFWKRIRLQIVTVLGGCFLVALFFTRTK